MDNVMKISVTGIVKSGSVIKQLQTILDSFSQCVIYSLQIYSKQYSYIQQSKAKPSNAVNHPTNVDATQGSSSAN